MVVPEIQHDLDMLEFQLCFLRPGQQTGRFEHILDLPAIQLCQCKLVQIPVCELLSVRGTSKELGPDVASGSPIEILVEQ